MEEELQKIYLECIEELNKIGINVLEDESVGKVEIHLSKRNNKRYGACKQEEPNKSTMYIEKIGKRKNIKYHRYNKHIIEISPWVMQLNKSIIKNTIMHEIIHCMPNCNNHGKNFREYAKYINEKLGYDISRVGNKKEDYEKSNLKYIEDKEYRYKIECEKCKQTFFRQRYNKNLTKKYRCGKCGGKLKVNPI